MKRSMKVEARGDRLSLRWSYPKERYYLALGLYDNPLARTVAQSRANQIEADQHRGKGLIKLPEMFG
jgi:hypothetical protein